MQYAYNKLRGRIVELFGTQKAFAASLGVSQNCVVNKLRCKWEFSQSDVERWANLLEIDRQEYGEFFYMWGGAKTLELTKSEEFAKKIIQMAAEEKLTVGELCKAADIAKGISDNSTVDVYSIEKTDFPSRHISVTCDGKELFGD